MGAIVGGLYASGMTARQIDATMRSLDWQEAFRDAPPRRDLAFRRKQGRPQFSGSTAARPQARQSLAAEGLHSRAEGCRRRLRQLTLPFSNSTDFDLLPTPFRAVSTDLETGGAVLMDRARPGDRHARPACRRREYSRRFELNGRLLVDGGLAENLPINVGPRDACGHSHRVGCELPLAAASGADSALSISNQMLAILVRKDSDRQRASLGPPGHFDRAESGLRCRD